MVHLLAALQAATFSWCITTSPVAVVYSIGASYRVVTCYLVALPRLSVAMGTDPSRFRVLRSLIMFIKLVVNIAEQSDKESDLHFNVTRSHSHVSHLCRVRRLTIYSV